MGGILFQLSQIIIWVPTIETLHLFNIYIYINRYFGPFGVSFRSYCILLVVLRLVDLNPAETTNSKLTVFGKKCPAFKAYGAKFVA